jgi:hypothetical protein
MLAVVSVKDPEAGFRVKWTQDKFREARDDPGAHLSAIEGGRELALHVLDNRVRLYLSLHIQVKTTQWFLERQVKRP